MLDRILKIALQCSLLMASVSTAEGASSEELPVRQQFPQPKQAVDPRASVDDRPYIGSALSYWTAEGHLKLIGIEFGLTREVIGTELINEQNPSEGTTNTSGSLLGETRGIEYRHRPLVNAGAALTGGIFSLSFDTVVGSLTNERTREFYVPKRAYDIRTALSYGPVFAEISILSYRGFSLHEYSVEQVPMETDPAHFPQLEMKQTALHLNYTFRSTKFSQRAPYDLSERQLRTAHAPFLTLSIERFSLRNADGESMIPEKIQPLMGTFAELSEFAGWNESIAFGYAVTVVPFSRLKVLAPFYANFGFSYGTAYNQSEIQLGESRIEKNLQGHTTGINMGLGFNGPAFFSALTYQTHFTISEVNELALELRNYSLAVLTGARF